LAQLLEKDEVCQAATSDGGIGVARLFVPVETLNGEGKRGYEGDGQRVRVAEYLVKVSLAPLILVIEKESYSHGNNEVCSSLLEAAPP
jgi:hypothetical protein